MFHAREIDVKREDIDTKDQHYSIVLIPPYVHF